MHSAPAVGLSVVRSRWHLGVAILGSSLGLWALVALIFQASFGAKSILIFASWVLCTWAALVGWTRSPTGLLQWDGQHWNWSHHEQMLVCRAGILLDFQTMILVRLYPENGDHFCIWLDAKAHAQKWIALRRALISGRQLAERGDSASQRLGVGELP
jgi:hypothetical protein